MSEPDILGMSGLLTASFKPMKNTVELVKKEHKKKLLINSVEVPFTKNG